MNENNIDYLIIRNPDPEKRSEIIQKIKRNNGFCISQKRSANTKCHCSYFHKTGNCLCGLFLKIPVIEIKEG